MSRLVFLDIETTGLDPDRHEPWEIALIVDGESDERVYRPKPSLRTADPTALRMTGFYHRTETFEWTWEYPPHVADRIAPVLAGAHLVGAVPSFDAAFLDRFLRDWGQAPAWHYHLIDVEAMAVGYLNGRADCGEPMPDLPLPWRSDDLARACGVEPVSDDERHTALGDARWVRRWYLALTEAAS
ncbi:hypothetical protein ER308_07070 [Egibacter rhizosphaerae]|uniref:Exonuclease domain-containing protein n=1 Tax=Egibacter rhizosphaerae TaxID=1670831 RepID=A0A411YDW6_9ACTN|nr:exonuclease domain-containing protein [Egibacter rhizosphaerae]QBI19327.1 hypothetical protein ER308_07070 [Egibacter rhizosphaerae]